MTGENRGQEAADNHLLNTLFSAAVAILGGHHVFRDEWFPGATKMRRKN